MNTVFEKALKEGKVEGLKVKIINEMLLQCVLE